MIDMPDHITDGFQYDDFEEPETSEGVLTVLNLTRYPGQKIIVTHKPSGEQMLITIGPISPTNQVKVSFDAGPDFIIDRHEIHLDKQRHHTEL